MRWLWNSGVCPCPWVVAVSKYGEKREAAVLEGVANEVVLNVDVSGIEEGCAAFGVGFLGQLFECGLCIVYVA